MPLNCWHIPTSEEETIDVYFEEVGELLEQIDDHMKTWMSHLGDKKTLTEIRRAFHTIKGSGRMANVLDLSELAWKVENMLNQAIAGAVPVSQPMVKLVATIRNQIPKMVDAFKNGRSIARNGDIVRLTKLADKLASEKNPAQIEAPPTAATTDVMQRSELYQFNVKLENCMQRANEALRRSEMALHQARQVSARNEDRHSENRRRNSAESDGLFGWPALVLSALFGGVCSVGVLVSILYFV